MDNPLDKSYKEIALCNEAFIENIKGKIESFGKKREITETKFAETHAVKEIIKKIADKLQLFMSLVSHIQRGFKGGVFAKL